MLDVIDLSFDYQEQPLLNKVAFHLPAGGLLHLRGANGAGKSTFLKILAGEIDPTKGRVEISRVGQEILGRSDLEDDRWTAWKLRAQRDAPGVLGCLFCDEGGCDFGRRGNPARISHHQADEVGSPRLRSINTTWQTPHVGCSALRIARMRLDLADQRHPTRHRFHARECSES